MLFRKSRQFLIIAATVMTIVAAICSTSSADDAGLPILFVEQCEDAEEESERESPLVDLAIATKDSAFHESSSLDSPLETPNFVGFPIDYAPHHERGPPVV
jgi:hypothetical protein